MRGTLDHTHTVRHVLGALAVVVATTLVSASPAIADDDTKSKTPLTAYKRFAFDVEVSMGADEATLSISVSTKGVYVKPHSQQCKATVSIGGLSVSQRAVMIGDTTWVGVGNGPMKKRSHRHAFEFADECASSPAFWKDFSFPHEPGIHGTTETRDGIAVEHFDFAEVFGALRGFIGEVPPDVTVERASVWQSKREGVVVGVDIALHATSAATCHEMLRMDAPDPAPAACSMAIRFGLSRFNDPAIKVEPVSAVNAHVTRT